MKEINEMRTINEPCIAIEQIRAVEQALNCMAEVDLGKADHSKLIRYLEQTLSDVADYLENFNEEY